MNNKYKNPGILAPIVQEYINMRKNLGFRSEAQKYSLFAFDAFACKEGLSSVTITKELAEKWCNRRPDEATDTWSHRNCFLRQFAIYLSNLGYDTYIPCKVFTKHDNFIPYIFSDDELGAIFKACDTLDLYDKHARSNLFVLPAFFRMLAGTGIRIGEASALLNKDVNLDQGYIVLRNCKNGKDRMVPLSESLVEVCRQYRKYRELLPHHSDCFFVKMNGCPCPPNSFFHWWTKILKAASIQRRGKTVGPRIHDLRHTFCVKSMASLAKEGKDLYYILPILSTYIGHQSIAATDRYVRMTSEMYPDLISQTDSICLYIFPHLKSQ
ncbi:tyrosine-type recombinase/integrase [Chitinophaga sp. LS1]|uniref:tyrosine-type recombinase/integrase n=1 Tax=Chitinophaga sp. LS1 TaxID=3051176 RepID=UPI002AAAA373|nr:tyrosine-type recombinase/integrase [Chitinophaga sp. LS1]WPV67140.1 tyrosine-type recombinase/integrase [Chitinophaga sp. LS1]WPV69650.1 tyrosine-type recombinase/integrase [Chitinophaga sp. LS1]WPV70344.1 tyrosine-type recombinase/integrase [Chitinophaga sp. LS1]WPV70551.1 tyrosine-type recombinase/integrase [Chitinophaga sp. LS1]